MEGAAGVSSGSRLGQGLVRDKSVRRQRTRAAPGFETGGGDLLKLQGATGEGMIFCPPTPKCSHEGYFQGRPRTRMKVL